LLLKLLGRHTGGNLFLSSIEHPKISKSNRQRKVRQS